MGACLLRIIENQLLQHLLKFSAKSIITKALIQAIQVVLARERASKIVFDVQGTCSRDENFCHGIKTRQF